MLVGLHMIMEQIIDLRDDVRQKQTLSEEISAAKKRLEVKGAPAYEAKQDYLNAKKSLAAGKKKKKGKPTATPDELKELTTKVNDTYRMWQRHMCGQDDVQKAADGLKKHLVESLENCRISVRPGSAVWFGKVRASSALTMDSSEHHYSTDVDKGQTSHRSLSRCVNIGLSDDLDLDAALATAELDGWRALGVDDEVEEVLEWTPHPLNNKRVSSTYEPKPYEAAKVTGGEGFPADKSFLIGQEGRTQEMWVDENDKSKGVVIKMTFEHKRMKAVFNSNGMKKELKEREASGGDDKDYYIMFKPEHVSLRASKNRSGTIKTDNGDGTFNVKWFRDENGKPNVEDEVKRRRIKLCVTGKRNSGDNRMPETTRQWLEYCESTWGNVTDVQAGAISNADISVETKGEDTEATSDTRMPPMLRLKRFRTSSLSRRKSALQSSHQPERKQEDDMESGLGKFGDHEWRSPLFWLVRGLRYHRNEMIKTKEQYLDLFNFVKWWLQALSGIDSIADLEDDTEYAMNHINEDFPGKAEARATDEHGKVVGGSPMYQVAVDMRLAQAWRAIECKSFARLKEVFSNFSLDEENGAPPNAEPLIQHLLQTRIGQGETWIKDRNQKGRFNQWCTSTQDGPNTVIQRRKWYRVGESFMRGNAFHLAVLVGDPEIFAFLLKSLRTHIFNRPVKSKTARTKAEDGGKDSGGETKDDADGSISDEKLDNMMNFLRQNGFSAAATAAAATAACKVSGVNISSDTSRIEEGSLYSITSPMYDAEVAQMCLNTLNAHGRSEMRCAIGRYNVLQTAAAFNKHKKAAPLLCGLLSHIEDMHSKPSKLVRKRETNIERKDERDETVKMKSTDALQNDSGVQ
jgi:hypothetical protein